VRPTIERRLERVIDANLNRSREGLRVCEDLCRFLYDLKGPTQAYKKIRHRLTEIALKFPATAVMLARDSKADVGRPTLIEEVPRRDVNDIFYANSQRVKESIRVLEECAKLLDQQTSEELKALRYAVYAAERDVLARSQLSTGNRLKRRSRGG